jgi:hypothetical protein
VAARVPRASPFGFPGAATRRGARPYGVTARTGTRPMQTGQEVQACKEHVEYLSFTKLGLWQDSVASNRVIAMQCRDIMLLHVVR